MSESQTAEAVAPVRRMRRALVLTTILAGVLVATNDLHALRLGLLADVIGPTLSGEEAPAGVWAVHAGYTIAWMVSLPLWGKLSDIFGRRRLWLAGLVLILAGSAGSATSQELIQLTISRLAQGLGVGAIFALGPALIGGLYPPAERAKRHGTILAVLWLGLIGTPILLSLAFGQILLVSIPGAGIGQFLLARSSLFLSLLVGGLVLLATWIGLPAGRPGIRRRFNVAGALAFVGTMAPLLLMYQWSGGLFPWLSAPSVGLLVGAAAMLVVLVIVERRASEPLIDIQILKQRVFVVAAITMFAAGIGLMALYRYSPSFFPLPSDRSFEAGWDPLLLLALMALAPATGAVFAGWIMARTGRHKALILVLLGIAMAGNVLLSRMDGFVSAIDVMRNSVITGLGLGGLFTVLLVVVQNACPRRNLGEVTAGMLFLGALGVTFGAGVLGRLAAAWQDVSGQGVNTQLASDAMFAAEASLQDVALDSQAASDLAAQIQREGALEALSAAFLVVAILLAVGFVLVMLLRSIPVVTETETDWDDASATGPLGLWRPVSTMKEARPSLAEILQAREEEQRRALEASRARAEQRRRAIDAPQGDAPGDERTTGGAQPPVT